MKMFSSQVVFLANKEKRESRGINGSAHFDLCGLSALFLRSEIVLVRVIHQHMIFGAILRALNKAFYGLK